MAEKQMNTKKDTRKKGTNAKAIAKENASGKGEVDQVNGIKRVTY